MAVPKKKVSRSRRNMRRFAAGNRLDKTTVVNCPSCNEPTRPHRITPKRSRKRGSSAPGLSGSQFRESHYAIVHPRRVAWVRREMNNRLEF